MFTKAKPPLFCESLQSVISSTYILTDVEIGRVIHPRLSQGVTRQLNESKFLSNSSAQKLKFSVKSREPERKTAANNCFISGEIFPGDPS